MLLVCPLCEKGQIIRGKAAYGCSEWKAGCRFVLKYEEVGENLTDAELKTVLDSKRGFTGRADT